MDSAWRRTPSTKAPPGEAPSAGAGADAAAPGPVARGGVPSIVAQMHVQGAPGKSESALRPEQA
eukprot:2683642-Alexandrium_andersonii.AAC.1